MVFLLKRSKHIRCFETLQLRCLTTFFFNYVLNCYVKFKIQVIGVKNRQMIYFYFIFFSVCKDQNNKNWRMELFYVYRVDKLTEKNSRTIIYLKITKHFNSQPSSESFSIYLLYIWMNLKIPMTSKGLNT